MNSFRDYNVRVWNGDVFINSYEVIGYAGGRSGEGIQTPTDNEELYQQFVDVCKNITEGFLKLDNLINRAREQND